MFRPPSAVDPGLSRPWETSANYAPVRLARIWKDNVEQAFTAEQACRLSNCTHHQLRYWDKVGLVKPSIQPTGGRPGVRRLYSFRDLVALRVVRSLLDNGMSLQRVRRAWDYLRREGDMESHLSDIKLVTDGLSIFRVSSDEGELMDALREGQLAFFVAIDEIAREVEEDVTRFELDRENFLTMLRRVEDDVEEELRASGS
jgi:DNA-binding transcriptional MerR regulator